MVVIQFVIENYSCVNAVSYTHLDVYKRQIVWNTGMNEIVAPLIEIKNDVMIVHVVQPSLSISAIIYIIIIHAFLVNSHT